MSERPRRSPMEDDGGVGGDRAIDYFESSIESLFGQHQAASGEAGGLYTVHLPTTGATDDDNDGVTLVYRIPASGTNKLFAHYQWDSGLVLCRFIHQHTGHRRANPAPFLEADVRGVSVLELGAGTGLPGLMSAKRGASSVMITDYPDEGIMSALREGVSRAGMGDVASVVGLDWADKSSLERIHASHADGFERILGADLLWLSSSHAALLNAIHTLLSHSPSARCILLSGFHTGRRALSHFFRLATTTTITANGRERKLVVSTDEHGSPRVAEYNVVTGCLRHWTGVSSFPLGGETPSDNCAHEDEESAEDNMDDHSERTKWLLYVSLQWAS